MSRSRPRGVLRGRSRPTVAVARQMDLIFIAAVVDDIHDSRHADWPAGAGRHRLGRGRNRRLIFGLWPGDIFAAGEEITFNYGYDLDSFRQQLPANAAQGASGLYFWRRSFTARLLLGRL